MSGPSRYSRARIVLARSPITKLACPCSLGLYVPATAEPDEARVGVGSIAGRRDGFTGALRMLSRPRAWSSRSLCRARSVHVSSAIERDEVRLRSPPTPLPCRTS